MEPSKRAFLTVKHKKLNFPLVDKPSRHAFYQFPADLGIISHELIGRWLDPAVFRITFIDDYHAAEFALRFA